MKDSVTFTGVEDSKEGKKSGGKAEILQKYPKFPRFRSIRFNLWLVFVSMTVVMLLFMWIYELIFYSTIYVSLQENDLMSNGDYFAKEYVTVAADKEAANNLVQSYSDDYDVTIVVFSLTENNESQVLYSASSTGIEASGLSGNLLNFYLSFLEGDDSYNRGFVTNTGKMNNTTTITSTSLMVIYGLKTVVGGSEQYIYLSVPMPSFSPAHNTLAGQLAVVSVVCLVIAILVSYFGAGWAARPMRELTIKVTQNAQSEKRKPLETNTNLAEINELSQAFNNAFEDVEKNNGFRRDLLANVSHDMKTPLTMIRAYSEMIRDISGGNKEKCAKQAQIIIDETIRLTALINEVVELSKLESGVLKLNVGEVNISEKMHEIVNRFMIMEECKGYTIVSDIEPDLMVRADGDKIDRVIYNLIGNAMNYTGEDKHIEVKCKKEGEYVRIEVIDTGKGMTKEEMLAVWDKYYRLVQDKRRVVGSGLGLSIVKSILDLHKTTYGIISEKGNGSTFWFQLKLLTP